MSSVDPLAQERDAFASQVEDLTTALHELSVLHYRQIVDARDSVARVTLASRAMDDWVSETTTVAVPAARTALDEFLKKGSELSEQHKHALSTIELNSQLLDLLTLPQIMDACARGGAVEEALEVCAFARALRARHRAIGASSLPGGSIGSSNNSSNIAIKPSERGKAGMRVIEQIADQIERSADALRRSLAQQLRGPIDLPTCLRVVGHLKRLDAQKRRELRARSSTTGDLLEAEEEGEEEEVDGTKRLCEEFLACRDAYLQSQAHASGPSASSSSGGDAAAPAGRYYQSALKVIQKNREVWFDVVTQYQAIFGHGPGQRAALAAWLAQHVEEFIRYLREIVARVDSCGELATILELASSFAASMGRVSGDFRPLLPRLFERRVGELGQTQWRAAGSHFKASLARGDWRAEVGAPPASETQPATEITSPPLSLLSFPVLAELVNAFLRSFNELRAFAALEARDALRAELERALAGIVDALEETASSLKNASADVVHKFVEMVKALRETALPYLIKAFDYVFRATPEGEADSALVARLGELEGKLLAR